MDRFDRDIGFPKKSRIYLFNQKRKKKRGKWCRLKIFIFYWIICRRQICHYCYPQWYTGKHTNYYGGRRERKKEGTNYYWGELEPETKTWGRNRTRFIKPGLGIPAPRTNNARQTTNADQPTRTAVALKPVISSRAHTKVPRKGRKVDRYSAATQRNTQAEKQKCLMHSANRTCRGAGKG